jgi:hypothetical protein
MHDLWGKDAGSAFDMRVSCSVAVYGQRRMGIGNCKFGCRYADAYMLSIISYFAMEGITAPNSAGCNSVSFKISGGCNRPVSNIPVLLSVVNPML